MSPVFTLYEKDHISIMEMFMSIECPFQITNQSFVEEV